MNLLISTLKIIFTFATVFFAALPFVFEYHTYLKDKEKKTANRRFRIMCFTMIYAAFWTGCKYLPEAGCPEAGF